LDKIIVEKEYSDHISIYKYGCIAQVKIYFSVKLTSVYNGNLYVMAK
jgi:hypothetical protein